MFANFFKDLIVSSFGTYIEDFTSTDIVIDKWNGQVLKENVTIKKEAFEGLCMSFLGAPVTVVKGFIKKLKIDVPWNKLLSKPCEVYLDEVHIILKSPPSFDVSFAKNSLLQSKKQQFQALLEQIRKQQQVPGNEAGIIQEENESYMKRLKKIISENLRLIITNVHIRFEDSLVSRNDQSFNLGIICDSINYQMTNNRFERVFINIDDKKQEQKSFSMLEVKQLAIYWNSNAQENWSKNSEYTNLSAQKTIDFSKKYIENMKRRHYQYQQTYTNNQTYLIQPCDIQIKFRKNLSPQTLTILPRNTYSMEISSIQLSLDEEVYKDIQYLTKFFSWHSQSINNNQHFKFRPSYNTNVKDNAKVYWNYAIKSTLYYIQKSKREKTLRQKRQNEMVELSHLYMMETVNSHFERTGSSQKILTTLIPENNNQQLSFNSVEELRARIKHLEYKLSPEQMVVAYKRSENMANEMIQQHAENSGWRSWIPGKIKHYWSSPASQMDTASQSSLSDQVQNDLDTIMNSYNEVIDEDGGTAEDQSIILSTEYNASPSQQNQSSFNKEKISMQFTLMVPKTEVSFVSKKAGAYTKNFMVLYVQDTFLQYVSNQKEDSFIYYVRNFEIIDKLMNQQKFAKALFRKDPPSILINPNKQSSQQLMQQSTNKRRNIKFMDDENYFQAEADEESNLFQNNGLPFIKEYEELLHGDIGSLGFAPGIVGQNRSTPFFLMQLYSTWYVKSTKEKYTSYRLDIFLNSLQLFYNRVLISRAQTFINMAKVHKVQNSSAEADFDSRIEELKHRTQEQVSKMLEKSELQICCNFKGIEILIPDNTNYDASKFILVQSGNLVMRSGNNNSGSSMINAHMREQMQKRMKQEAASILQGDSTHQYLIDFDNIQKSSQRQEDIFNVIEGDEQTSPTLQDEYSFAIYDFQVFYIPSNYHLDNFQYNENSSETDRYQIWRKSDLLVDYQSSTEFIKKSSPSLLSEEKQNKVLKRRIQVSMNSIDISMTNKEVKELKNFYDNFVKYHEQISLEVQRELNFINSQQVVYQPKTTMINTTEDNELEDEEEEEEKQSFYQTVQLHQSKKSSPSLMRSVEEESKTDQSQNTEQQDRAQIDEQSEDEEFFDAIDVFDKDIIQMLNLDENFQTLKGGELSNAEHAAKRVKKLIQQKVIVEVWITKIKVSILEATNFQQELVQSLRQRYDISHDQVKLDVKYKGSPFINFEIGRMGLIDVSYNGLGARIIGVKEICLLNLEKSTQPQVIFKSQNYEVLRGGTTSRMSLDKTLERQPIFDLEDEDKIEEIPTYEKLDDFFIRTCKVKNLQENGVLDQKTKIEIGLVEIEITDHLLNKVMDTLIIDFPMKTNSNQQQAQSIPELQEQKVFTDKLEIIWEGLDARMKVKRDVTLARIIQCSITQRSTNEEKHFNMEVDDIRLSQNDVEILLKYKDFSTKEKGIIELEKVDTFKQEIKNKLELQRVLINLDFNQILVLANGLLAVHKLIQKRNAIDQQRQAQIQEQDQLSVVQQEIFELKIQDSFIQIPLKDSKNQLFLKTHEMNICKNKKDQLFSFEDRESVLFVAKSIDQALRYKLLESKDLQVRIIGQESSILEVNYNSLQLFLNENFILLIANIVELHFDDMMSLIQKFKNEESVLDPNLINQELENIEKSYIQKELLDHCAQANDLSKFIKCKVFALNNKVISIKVAKMSKLSIQWVFGMGFDDHEDTYVTLFNKNFSQQILSQFEQKSSSQQEFETLIDTNTPPKKLTNTEKESHDPISLKQYERLTIDIIDIQRQQLKYVEPVKNSLANEVRTMSSSIVQFKHVQFYHQKLNKSTLLEIKQQNPEKDKFACECQQEETNGVTKIKLDIFEVLVSQNNAQVISTIAKNIYSCKNILKRGKKRELIKQYLSRASSQDEALKYYVTLDQKLIRIKFYDSDFYRDDSLHQESGNLFSSFKRVTTHKTQNMHSSFFKDQLNQTSKFDNEFQSSSSQTNSKQFVIETSFHCAATNDPKYMKGLDLFQLLHPPLSRQKLKLTDLSIYLEKKKNCINPLDADLSDKVIILLPVDIYLQKVKANENNREELDTRMKVSISLLELEVSFKQYFYIQLLLENIITQIQPLTQLIKHMNQQKQNSNTDIQVDEYFLTQSKKAYTKIEFEAPAMYFALIRESGDAYLLNDSLCMPLFSLELKNVQAKYDQISVLPTSSRSSKSKPKDEYSCEISIPLELYYFNNKLNFYEPLIESTIIQVNSTNDKKSNQVITIHTSEVINFNLSVALYETIFTFINNLTQEDEIFQKLKKISAGDKSEDILKQQFQNDLQFTPSQFFVKNNTGELLLFKTQQQPAFIEVPPDEVYPLDFEIKKQKKSKQVIKLDDASFDGYNVEDEIIIEAVHSGSDEEEDDQVHHQQQQLIRKPLSSYRREHFKQRRGDPKKVYLQLITQSDGAFDKSSVFEVNIDSLICQRIYLDDARELYVICQTQTKNGQKYLIVRSPMQITNNLQIAMEVKLIQNKKSGLDSNYNSSRAEMGQNQSSLLSDEHNNSNMFSQFMDKGSPVIHSMMLKPEQSMIVPLKACGFNKVQIRPILIDKSHTGSSQIDENKGDYSYFQTRSDPNQQFEWTREVEMSLLSDEREIFETRPIILSSKMLKHKKIIEKQNNRIFFALNANVYSIRSFIDFNTQQTDFISMRYLSISPPFIIQNLLPAPLTIFFMNIQREQIGKLSKQQRDIGNSLQSMNPSFQNSGSHFMNQMKDKQLYDLEMKMNSSMQVLYLNPQGNFDISLCIPGFEHSDFMPFKEVGEEDFLMSQDEQQESYIDALFEKQNNLLVPASALDDPSQSQVQQELQPQKFTNKYRFLRQKRLLFCMTSRFQNQFNICANIAFIHGFYHISFYSKYWFLNNTQMPLQNNFSFDKMDLPYENMDFDFESIAKFDKEHTLEPASKDKEGKQRKMSLDSFQTETIKDGVEGKQLNKHSSVMSQSQRQEQQVNYKDLYTHLNKVNGFGYGRMKPWESYRQESNENQGLISALTNEDINKISTFYLEQEADEEELEDNDLPPEENPKTPSTSKGNRKDVVVEEEKSSRYQESQYNQQKHIQMQNIGGLHLERQTLLSKTSIQMMNYLDFIVEQQSVPLNHTELGHFNLFPTPLKDKDQIKRVVLFSDNPIEEQLGSQQSLKLQLCDSEWSEIPFELAKLQGEPIYIKDKERPLNSQASLFEVVAHIQYLPYPFSFSKLITFQPRYVIVNKTPMTLHLVQANCEDKGIFKVFPYETSVFHWTDSKSPHEICVKLEEYEYSGNFRIDSIGELNIRLRSSFDRECIILNTSISEETTNTLFIVFSDVSYNPPYRIENLTKTSFKISQKESRGEDFDILRPYNIISFGWSYPLKEKLIQISICSQTSDEDLGVYSIDSINKNESIALKGKTSKKDFILEIINEKTIKVVRIIYPSSVIQQESQSKNKEEGDNKMVGNKQGSNDEKSFKVNVKFEKFGISIVNSQAREIAYVYIQNLKYSHQSAMKNRKMTFKASDIQIDNQLVRQNDAIILKRQPGQAMQFIKVKMHYINNDAIENLYYYKYFIFEIVPFDLNLDGNFCDESYKYFLDIFSSSKRHQSMKKHQELGLGTGIGPLFDEAGDDIKDMKLAAFYNQNKEQTMQKKIYFEQFFVNEIKMNFTFSSSPILFREFTMNPTLKFFIVMLSNLKNVQLKFNKYTLQHQHLLLPIFLAQFKRHYIYQCYSHKQFLKIVSSMGLFGNIGETFQSLQHAAVNLVYQPIQQKDLIYGLYKGSTMFVKESVFAISGSIGSVFGSLKRGAYYLASGNGDELLAQDSLNEMGMIDRELFEDDIEQVQRGESGDLSNYSSPLATIDTQNKIWLKIITREQQNYEVKRRMMKRKKEDQTTNEVGVIGNKKASNKNVVKEERKDEQNQIALQRQHRLLSHNDLEDQQKLNEFFRRQGPTAQSNILFRGIKKGFTGLLYLPRICWSYVTYLTEFEENQGAIRGPQKIRPPRFVSFSMELEPYSIKKAYALEILNNINLNVYGTETISITYTLNKNELIFTGKRIICVQEQDYFNRSHQVYKHWNIFFKDILRVEVELYDKLLGQKISQDSLNQILNDPNNNSKADNHVVMLLKILYHYIDYENLGSVEGGEKINLGEGNGNGNGGRIQQEIEVDGEDQEIGTGRNRTQKKSKRRVGKGVSNKKQDWKQGAVKEEGFGDLRIGQKILVSKLRDTKLVQKIYQNIQQRISHNFIK